MNSESKSLESNMNEEDLALAGSMEWLRNKYEPENYDHLYEDDAVELEDGEIDMYKESMKKRCRFEVSEETLDEFDELFSTFRNFLQEEDVVNRYEFCKKCDEGVIQAYMDFIKYCLDVKKGPKAKKQKVM